MIIMIIIFLAQILMNIQGSHATAYIHCNGQLMLVIKWLREENERQTKVVISIHTECVYTKSLDSMESWNHKPDKHTASRPHIQAANIQIKHNLWLGFDEFHFYLRKCLKSIDFSAISYVRVCVRWRWWWRLLLFLQHILTLMCRCW